MAFQDLPMKAGPSGRSVTGLALSKTAVMTLELAAGTVSVHKSGQAYTLASAQSHAFSSDPSQPTQVFMGLIDNGSITDLWVDAFVDDGKTVQAKPPSGYELVLEVAWFTIAAGETDLDNGTIHRRVWQ
jgi:hypothetical protein